MHILFSFNLLQNDEVVSIRCECQINTNQASINIIKLNKFPKLSTGYNKIYYYNYRKYCNLFAYGNYYDITHIVFDLNTLTTISTQ